MAFGQPGKSEDLLPEGPRRIFLLHEISCLEHGYHAIDEIHKGSRCHRIGQVEPVHSGFLPLLQSVCYLLQSSRQELAGQPGPGQIPKGLGLVGCGLDKTFHKTPHGVGVNRSQWLVQINGG